METVYLKEFITFTESFSYSKAAKDLYITQPTLRSHIKSLEDEIGAPLLVRQEGSLKLSLAGRYLLKQAREIVDLAEIAKAECERIRQNSTSILAGTMGYPLFEKLLASARHNLFDRNPQLAVEVKFASSTCANIASIIERTVDITCLPRLRNSSDATDPSSLQLPLGIDAFFLQSEPCSFWMTAANPLFKKETIRLSDLSGQSLLLGNTDNMVNAGKRFSAYFDEEGVDVQIDHQPFDSYNDYVFTMYQNGFGVLVEALHPTMKSHEDRRVFQIEDLPMRYDMYAMFDRSTFDDIGLSYLSQLEALLTDA